MDVWKWEHELQNVQDDRYTGYKEDSLVKEVKLFVKSRERFWGEGKNMEREGEGVQVRSMDDIPMGRLTYLLSVPDLVNLSGDRPRIDYY